MPIHKRYYLLFFIILALVGFAALPLLAQDIPPNAPCQTHRLVAGVNQGRVREQPSEDALILGSVARSDTLCIQGVAENNLPWLIIKLEDADGAARQGFISNTIVEPGAPGQITDPTQYCDAYSVINDDSIVRAGASTTFAVVDSFAAGEIICVKDYVYIYNGWYNITQPNGTTGWITSDTVDYQYDEALACVNDESYVVTAETELYTCAGRGCASSATLPIGSKVCLVGETEESVTWITFSMPDRDGRDGWMVMDLLEPIISEEGITIEQAFTLTPEPATGGAATPAGTPVAQVEVTAETVAVTLIPSATATTLPTGTPDGAITPVAQLCPSGSTPIEAGACITATPTPIPGLPQLTGNGLLLARDVTLESMFVPPIELLSPEGSIDFSFSIPDDWVVGTPTTLFLTIDYAETFASVLPEGGSGLSSQLDVRMDDVLVSSITLNSDNVGRQTLQIPIPDALMRNPDRRFHSVRLLFNASEYCDINAQARLTISNLESAFRFVYEEALPVLDFAFYPVPFYNSPIGTEVESVIFVLPETPNDGDLQAAASVAGGLGILSGDNVEFQFAFDSQLSPADWQNNNLILIGEVDEHIQIRDLYRRNVLPSTWDGTTLTADEQTIAADEGLLHLVANPDNANRAILVVTGQSELAVARAGQALGGRPSIIGITGTTAVIFDSSAVARFSGLNDGTVPPIYLFSDLNAGQDIVLRGVGVQVASFNFDVPIGGEISEDAYIEIRYNNSTTIENQNATLTVAFNDIPVASTRLQRGATDIQTNTDTITTEAFRTLQARIPQGIIVPGERNTVTLIADLGSNWTCDIPDGNTLWVTISKESSMYLPQIAATSEELYPLVSQFPSPYNMLPNLSDVLISLPDPLTAVEGQQLVEITSFIADTTRFGEGFSPVIFRGELPESVDRTAFNFIVLGRPTTNAFLRELNEGKDDISYLLQPFDPNTDDFIQVYDDVSYRLRDRTAVGVLQTFTSPWNEERRVTVLSGSEALGQLSASNALLNIPFGRSGLRGDVVFTTFNSAFAIDTRDIDAPIDLLTAIATVANEFPTQTPLLVGSSTPLPITPTITATPLDPLGVVEPLTPVPTTSPSPYPTVIIPTPGGTGETGGTGGPSWVLLMIGVSVVIVIVGGVYTLYTELRPKKKDTDIR
jgi:hypothetical protein